MSGVKAPLRPVAPAMRAEAGELRDFLAAHPGIEAFDLLLVDSNGILRGKTVRRHEMEGIYENGRNLPGSILGLDVAGEDVNETGLVWSDGDADRCAWPVPSTLAPAPWTDPPKGQFRVVLHEIDGAPVAADPRHVLRRQIEALAARGFQALVAFELEFYLVETAGDGAAQPLPAILPLTGERSGGTHVYSIEELDRLEPFTRDLYRAAAAQGLPVETLISEYAPGQFELTLHHREAMQAAEDLIALKHLLRGVARRHGMKACFMAKPYGERAGNGFHVHFSLADAQGRNVFDDGSDQGSEMMRHAVGGLLSAMAESTLVFAPHYNSYRRLRPKSYAPTAVAWGYENRMVAIRIPGGPSAARRIEHRVSGADANPYLVLASILGAALIGIERELSPGEPSTTDVYDRQLPKLPPDWASATALFESGTLMADILPAPLRQSFIACKRQELDTFALQVSDFEIETYLESV